MLAGLSSATELETVGQLDNNSNHGYTASET